jgi:hypothetical protein
VRATTVRRPTVEAERKSDASFEAGVRGADVEDPTDSKTPAIRGVPIRDEAAK